jgi:murein DD-endopeptidase MepM/ murein hydrolase activator NlpD
MTRADIADKSNVALRVLSAAVIGATLLLVLLASNAPAAGQVTPEDLAEAEARLDELRSELFGITENYEAALARDVQLETQITALEGVLANRTEQAADLRIRITDRIVDMYQGAAEVGLATMFSADEPAEVGTRTQYLRDAGVSDRALLNDLTVLSEQLEADAAALEDARSEQRAALAELETIAADLNERLTSAQTEYNELYSQFLEEERRRQEEARRRAEEEARRRAEEEAARQAEEEARNATSTTAVADETDAADGTDETTATTAPPDTTTTTAPAAPSPTSDRACPINGITAFSDTWGAPRSGGRFHQGVDMLAARGTPVVAVGAGTVTRMGNGGLGGITVYLRTSDGDEYYYAHLDSWASGLSAGQSVAAGDLLGTVGTTGNAPAHIPHLHWEYHPGGGGAVNPTPLARELCG